MCHSVTPFSLKTLGDRSGWNEVHTVPMDQDCFSCTKKGADLFVQNLRSFICLIIHGGDIYAGLDLSFRHRGAILGRMVFPYPFMVKRISAPFLFNQRLR